MHHQHLIGVLAESSMGARPRLQQNGESKWNAWAYRLSLYIVYLTALGCIGLTTLVDTLVCRSVDLFEQLLQALFRLRFGFLEGAVLICFD